MPAGDVPAVRRERERVPRRAMSWRRLLTIAAGLFWTATLAMLFHESREPAVLGRYSADYAALLALAAGAALLVTVIQWPPVYARLARVRIVPALPLLAPIAIGAVTAEVLVRSLDLFGASYYGEIARFAANTVPDPDLNYRLQPGLRDVYQGMPIALNELGLRERSMAAKTPGRPRVLLLGDSVTFGWGVRVEETFGRQLETLLPLDTVNSGVPSYNSEVELRFLRRHGDAIAPDAVLLLFVENDVDPTLEPPPQDLGSLRRLWTHPSLSIQHLLHTSRVYSMFAHFAPMFLPASAAAAGVADPLDAPGWREAMSSLRQIAAWCRAREVPFVVFLYRMSPDPRTDLQASLIGDLAARDTFGFEDVLPWFTGRDPRRLSVSFVDGHPNAEGHRLLADGIAEYLATHGVLAAAEAAHRQSPRDDRLHVLPEKSEGL